jgi:hypothetical protein
VANKGKFNRWMKAAYRHHDGFDDWAKQGLDALADEENAAALKIADAEKTCATPKKSSA